MNERPGIIGIGGVPQVRCCHTAFKPSYSKVAVWVSEMFDLPSFWTKMPPAERDAFGPAEVEHPAGGVEHVDAHVADDAVAVFGEGAPPTSVRQAVVRAQRRRAGPHFVIEIVRHGLDRRVAVGAHVEIAAHFDVADLAEQPGLDDLLLRVDQVRRALALGADLHHALVFARRVDHGLAFRTSTLMGFWQ